MIWVVNAEEFGDKLEFTLREGSTGGFYHTYRWKYGRKKWGECETPVYLDLTLSSKFQHNKMLRLSRDRIDYGDYGEDIFLIKNFHRNDGTDRPVGGWGQFLSKDDLLRKIGVPVTNIIKLPPPPITPDSNDQLNFSFC